MPGRLYIGIDPGKKGGIAAIQDGALLDCFVMPTVGGEVSAASFAGWLKHELPADLDNVFVVMEKVGSMPNQGVKSMFTFGTGFGLILGVLAALDISHSLVPPKTWQQDMHTGIAGKDPKKRSLIAAQRLFPRASFIATERSRVPHDGIVDAVLLAEYGRRRGY